MNNDHTARWSMTERFDIVKPHVALLCVPGFEWVMLREYCLASGRKVIAVSQGLNFKSRVGVSALEPSDPSPMCTQKFGVLPFCAASVKSKSSVVEHKLLAKIYEGCVFDTDSNFSGGDGGIGTDIGVPSVGVCHKDFSLSV